LGCALGDSDLKGAGVAQRHFLGYESMHQPLLSRRAFAKRLGRSIAVTVAFVGISLFAGMCGYRYFEDMLWIDAFVNAAMILSGMGPVTPLQTWGGKLFAGLYALYSGLAVILAAGLLLAPILHRILHRFHLPTKDN
jgi:hypothetical protein